MRRTTFVLMTLAVLLLSAGLAGPAGAAVITPDLQQVFTRAAEGDAMGVATTPGGASAYACGYRLIINHGNDVTVDRVGTNAWSKFWNGPAGKADKGMDVAVSASGAVYVVGSSQKASGASTALVLKYSSGGKLAWARRWSGPTGSNPSAARVLIDAKGRIVVVGRASVNGTGHVFAAKYTAAGTQLWVRTYAKGHLGLARDVCLDGSGNLYISGEYQATTSSSRNALLLKYSPAGSLLWQKTYDSPYGEFDTYLAVCRRPGGGVYVAGSSERNGSDYDGIVMRYTGAGTRSVVVRLGDNDNAYTEFYDVAVTSDGHIVAGGGHSVGSGDSDFVIASYTAAGDEAWAHTIDSMYLVSRTERCELLGAYADGHVAATGFWARVKDAENAYSQVVRTYFFDAAGSIEDASLWSGATSGETKVHDIAVKGAYVWIAGQCYATTTGADGYALRFDR